jgi:hypothetical protein
MPWPTVFVFSICLPAGCQLPQSTTIGTDEADDEEEDNWGITRGARVTRAARFGRSLALPP